MADPLVPVTRIAEQTKRQVERARREFAEDVSMLEDVDPAEIFGNEMKRAAAMVEFIGQRVRERWGVDGPELTVEGLSKGMEVEIVHPIFELYRAERRHAVDVAKMAHSTGMEERRVRLQETQVQVMMSIVRNALERLGVEFGEAKVQRALREAIEATAEAEMARPPSVVLRADL
jgi:hypothetical protein